MKHTYPIYIFPLVLLFFQLSADVYTDYAKQWSLRYIHFRNGQLRVNKHELQAIHDLIASSARRSQTTREAQQEALNMVTLHWHVWQNIAQTRLNPSHNRPFSCKRTASSDGQTFWRLIEEQEQASQQYAQIAQKVVHGDVLSSKLAKGAVADMRAQARIFMLDALTDVKTQLGNLYEIAFKKTRDIDDLSDDELDDLMFRGFNIADFILAYVPNLALNTFVHADKTHNVLTQEAWQVLEKIQLIGNQVWDAIETARSAFYQALLDELK